MYYSGVTAEGHPCREVNVMMRVSSSRRGRAVVAGFIAMQMLLAMRASAETRVSTGALPDGTAYRIDVPDPWNGVLLIARAGFMFDRQLQPPPTEIAGFGQVQEIASGYEADVYWLSGTLGAGIETRRFALQLGYGYVSEYINIRRPALGKSRDSSHLFSLSALVRFGASP